VGADQLESILKSRRVVPQVRSAFLHVGAISSNSEKVLRHLDPHADPAVVLWHSLTIKASGNSTALCITRLRLVCVTAQQQFEKVLRCVLTATKRNPGQFTVPGLCRLLPQLVGSFDPGGGAGGQLPPGSGLSTSNVSDFPPDVAPSENICNQPQQSGADRGCIALSRAGLSSDPTRLLEKSPGAFQYRLQMLENLRFADRLFDDRYALQRNGRGKLERAGKNDDGHALIAKVGNQA
jgi:hypothetical protein